MKQVILIFLLTAYSLSTLGIGVKRFYCCGKLKSTNLVIGLQDKSKCANGDENDGCCNTKVETYKVKESHVTSDNFDFPVKHFTAVDAVFPSFDLSLHIATCTNGNATHAPPDGEIVPLHILHCVYRI